MDERVDSPARSVPVLEIKPSLRAWQGSQFGFGDFLDIINPLQHVPVISTLYRMFTGDQIGSLPRLLGGALYGRLMGIPSLISSLVNAVVGIATGKDIGEHVFAFIGGSLRGSNGGTEIQTAQRPPTEVNLGAEQPYGANATYGPEGASGARMIRLSPGARRGAQAMAAGRLDPAREAKTTGGRVVFEPVFMPFQSWSGKAPAEILDLYEQAAQSNSQPRDGLSDAWRE
jgi:hypothetical protein